MNYLTIDLGYDVLRGTAHKIGAFVGYNRYRTLMNALGCIQVTNPPSGVCNPPPVPPWQVGISEDDTWNALRLGVSADVQLSDRLGINLDLAYLPYVYVDSLDTHWLREPPLLFRTYGSGNGLQGELIVSYRLTKAFSVGIGGRYWSMWTNNTWSWPLGPLPTSGVTTLNTERYGVFVQASYQFGKP